MIIKKLKLKDFRQFYGENELTFGTGEKNVTIVMGANGNGKTGIFRAMMFAMYGDQIIGQDENISDINLINLDRLEEAGNQAVKASVELFFEFSGDNYLIRREVVGLNQKNKIETRIGEAELFIIDSSGNYEGVAGNPDVFINHILEKEIREFFFFDAEKMQLLDTAKTTKNISKEVKTGIIRLLQIKNLDDGSRILKQMITEKNSDIKAKAKDEEFDQKSKEKSQLEIQLAENEKLKVNLISERQLAKDENEEIELKLGETKQIRELMDKKSQENRILQLKRDNIKEKKERSKDLIQNMTPLLAQDFMDKNEQHFQGFQDQKKDKIPLELIEETLTVCKCSLCQTAIESDSMQHKMLEQLREEYHYSETTPIITNILRVASKNRMDKPLILKNVKTQMSKISQDEEEINAIELQIKKLNDLIGDHAANQDNLRHLENSLVRNNEKIKELDQAIQKYEFEQKRLERDIVDLDRVLNNLIDKMGNVKQDRSVKQKLEAMLQIIDEVTSEYTTDSIDMLSMEMTQSLHKLLDIKDRYIFKEVRITKDFEMEILDNNGVNRLQDLSMGQGQIFTLSFILSLAKIASKGRNEVNFPLFMDTPFGRLSGNNRDNLIKNIPQLVNQWILLLTDTELTQVEQNAFNDYETTDHIFELINMDGKTTIKQLDSILDLQVRR